MELIWDYFFFSRLNLSVHHNLSLTKDPTEDSLPIITYYSIFTSNCLYRLIIIYIIRHCYYFNLGNSIYYIDKAINENSTIKE